MFTSTENLERQLRRTAGILGLIQGLAWSIMSIICIVLYIQKTSLPDVHSYMDKIGYLMYGIFLGREIEPFSKQALRPSVFFAFMWIYLVLNIAWVAASANIVDRKSSAIKLPRRVKFWAQASFAVSLLDLITVIILGADYNNCLNMYEVENYIIQETCTEGILPVLVIAAKGFTLWFVNVIFAQVLYNMSQRLQVQQVYAATTYMTPPPVVQPPYNPQGYSSGPTTPNWSTAAAQHPQYQHQMSYPRN